MTKIHIQNLTINLSSGNAGVAMGLPHLLGMILSRVAEDQADKAEGTGETTGAAPLPEDSPTAEDGASREPLTLTGDDVLAFLRSDERYEYRTMQSVRDYFGALADAAAEHLDRMVDDRMVTTKRRRSDGVTLYKAAPAAQVTHLSPTMQIIEGAAETTLTPAELNAMNVRSFLGSDPRYTQRSITAIAKHFNLHDDDAELDSLLEDMANDGEIGDILCAAGSLEHKARRLIDRANANGGRDNITVLLAQATSAPATRPGLVSRLLRT